MGGGGRVRILVINPVGTPRWDESDLRIYRSYLSSDAEVTVKSLPEGPPSVENPLAHAWAEYLVIKYGVEWVRGYDATVVNCFLDPGVEGLRALVKAPVVGPCEASLALARAAGLRRPAIVTAGNKALWMIEDRVRRLGYGGYVAGVYGIGLTVLELDEDRGRTVDEVVEACERALRGGADSIVLGCTGLAGIAEEVSERVGAPVVDPAGAAARVAEAAAVLRLARRAG